jgi:cytochrome c oxidase assembly protein subunit 15
MTELFPQPSRPVPRWVRVWSVLTAAVALLLLFVLGGFVTSFRVGMADPVWPTEPWYLLGQDWKRLEFGFLVEHTHRAAGWIFGAMTAVLALGAWASEPNPRLRWIGLLALVLLIVLYGQFHRGMSVVDAARKAGHDAGAVPLPLAAASSTVIAAIMCLSLCAGTIASGTVGRWARAAAVAVMIAAMIQGLLGGFRVLFDQLAGGTLGPALAAVHGTFAQVVFALLAAVVFLTARRKDGDALPLADRLRLQWLAVAVPAAVFAQLVWGVWLRHYGSPVAQRLHVLTAFVVTGLVVWLAVSSLATADRRRQIGFGAWHLIGIVAVQVLLGVEGWMSKYAAVLDPHTSTVVRVGWAGNEAMSAAVRTGHVVIGTALLASTVVFALRVWRSPIGGDLTGPRSSIYMDSGVRLGEPMTHS